MTRPPNGARLAPSGTGRIEQCPAARGKSSPSGRRGDDPGWSIGRGGAYMAGRPGPSGPPPRHGGDGQPPRRHHQSSGIATPERSSWRRSRATPTSSDPLTRMRRLPCRVAMYWCYEANRNRVLAGVVAEAGRGRCRPTSPATSRAASVGSPTRIALRSERASFAKQATWSRFPEGPVVEQGSGPPETGGPEILQGHSCLRIDLRAPVQSGSGGVPVLSEQITVVLAQGPPRREACG